MSVIAAQSPPGESRDDWQTPACILERVRRVAPIGLDPCTSLANPCAARRIAVEARSRAERLDGREVLVDGLGPAAWREVIGDGELAYVNPPYSRGNLARWTERCRAEALAGAEVIALVPAATSEKWFQSSCAPRRSAAVCFWRGRIRFTVAGARLDSAPFSSALVYFGPRRYRFADAFADAGAIWM